MRNKKVKLGLAAAVFLVGAAVGVGVSYWNDSDSEPEPQPSGYGNVIDMYHTEAACSQALEQSAPSYPNWELNCTLDGSNDTWLLTFRDVGVP